MSTFRNCISSLCSNSLLYRQARKWVQAFGGAEGGGATIFFAISSPVWLGAIAMGIEVGSWYYYQQRLQATADAVAVSIAARAGTGPSQAELNTLTVDFLQRNGFDLSRGTWEATLSNAPEESVFVNNTTVNVHVTSNITRLLTGIFTPGSFTIQASAAAQVSQATEACILSLATAGAGNGLEIGPAANVRVRGCEVVTNHFSFFINGGARLDADCLRLRESGIGNFGTLNLTCPNGPIKQAGMTLDPYVDLEELDGNVLAPTCMSSPSGAIEIRQGDVWEEKLFSYPVSGRTYARLCNGTTLRVTGSGLVTMPPNWTLIFDGAEFDLEDGTNLTGQNVSFYFSNNGRPIIQAPNSRVILTADASGMLFRGARANTAEGNPNQIIIGPGSNFQGAVYFPRSNVQFQASGSFNGCPQIIGSMILLQGTWTLSGPCAAPGILPIVASRITRLTQ